MWGFKYMGDHETLDVYGLACANFGDAWCLPHLDIPIDDKVY